MALNPVNGDVIRLTTVVRTTLGQNQLNVSHWQVGSLLGTGRSLFQCGAALSQALAPSLIAAIPASSAFQGVLFRIVKPGANASQTFRDTGDEAAGDLAGDVLPSQTAGLLVLKAQNGPPRSAVRHYLPSTTEAQGGANGAPVAGYLTLMGDIGIAMTTPVTATDGAGNSLVLTPVARWNAATTFPLDIHEEKAFWATQRRRSATGRPDTPLF